MTDELAHRADYELPGMWEQADLMGGATDCEVDYGRCPAASGSHEQCPTSLHAGWRCGWCGALLSQGRWYPPELPGSSLFAGLGGRLDLGQNPSDLQQIDGPVEGKSNIGESAS